MSNKALPTLGAADILEARIACMQAAVDMRTGGSTPDAIVAAADVLWRWVSALPMADNRGDPPAR